MVDKVYGHADVLSVVVPFTYTDFTTAVVEAIAQLPAYAQVVGGDIVISTAFNYGTSAVLDIGDAADDDRYTATQINLNAAARTALTVTGYQYTAPTDIITTPTLAGTAATAGAGRITILYTVEGRSNYVGN